MVSILADLLAIMEWHTGIQGACPPDGDPALLNRLRAQLILADALSGRVVSLPGRRFVAVVKHRAPLSRSGMLLYLALADPHLADVAARRALEENRPLTIGFLVEVAGGLEYERGLLFRSPGDLHPGGPGNPPEHTTDGPPRPFRAFPDTETADPEKER
jgi:hypothetical protein